MKLEREDLSRFLLQYHNLLNPQQMSDKKDILNYISKVGCIQFDPLCICGKNPDLVLQSRIKNYNQNWLQELLYEDRQLLDGWDKMMSIYLIRDWPFFSRLREEMNNSYLSRYHEVKPHLQKYLDEVSKLGPVSSLQFSGNSKVNWAWGSARLAKAALEGLYYSGELSIHHREHTRRVYDLTERLLPSEILSLPEPYPDLQEYRKAHILRRVKSAGIAGFSSRDFWYGIASSSVKEIKSSLSALIEEGHIRLCKIEGSSRDWYLPAKAWEDFLQSPEELEDDSPAVFLAPLDNMMWNRELLEDLFGFYYRWEVYTPAEKRQFGYYVLPVLYRGRLIGRCEPVHDRKKNALIIKGLWLEQGVQCDGRIVDSLRRAFSRFGRFLKADRITTSPGLNRDFRKKLSGITFSE